MEYIDLKTQYQRLKPEIDSNIQHVIEHASFILGENVREFEERLADYVGVKYVVTCSDGTAALQLIYMAYGIGPGDAVFCPDMTFFASVEPACLLGATPVFCEIDAGTYNIDSASLERQIKHVLEEGKLIPKAIIAVDFLGNPVDFDVLRPIADKYNLLLVEDAAQAMGSSYKGRKCGSLGDVAATSFFPSKPLGCYGDGGAVFTNDDDLYHVLLSLRVHGKGKTKYDNVRVGLNSRLDSIQAAVLIPKLAILEEEVNIRQQIAKRYYQGLQDRFQTPVITKDAVSAYAQYVIWAKDEEEREQLQKYLKKQDIPTIRYYPCPLHLLPVFEGVQTYGEDYGITEKYAKNSFGIPFSPYLTTEDQEKVIKVLLKRG